MLSLVGNAGTLITYTIGIFVNWRQLAFILVLLAVPYVVGLIIFLPNDFPQASQVALLNTKRKLERRPKRRTPADKNCKTTSSTEKFFKEQHPEINTQVIFTKKMNFYGKLQRLFIVCYITQLHLRKKSSILKSLIFTGNHHFTKKCRFRNSEILPNGIVLHFQQTSF